MKLLWLFLVLFSFGFLFAQDTLSFNLGDTLIVTGTRIPTKSHESSRSISTITQTEIQTQPVRDVDDILNYSPVDLQERGLGNVQADLSLRGSKNGQLLVLWDGININDPQTGHFFANIPAPFNAIGQSQIMTGGSSSMYGAQAFGGVINFIPRELNGTRYGFHSVMGSFSSRQAGGYLNLMKGRLSFANFFDYAESDGHRKNTDYRVANSFHMLEYKGEKMAHRLGIGHQQKDFGAQDFYAPYDSRERNESILIYLKNKIIISDLVSAKINSMWKKHSDRFVLFSEDPGYYTNNHRTEKSSFEVALFFDVHPNFSFVTGTSYGEDYIYSTGIRRGQITDSSNTVISTYPVKVWALGKHRRINKAAFAEARFRRNRLLLNAGFRADYNTFYKSDYSPSFDLAWYMNRNVKMRAAYSHAFRAPDYTELFYVSPKNIGNPGLTSESADNYEIGLDLVSGGNSANLTLFLSDALNVIDWVLKDTTGVYQTQNFNHLENRGFEFKARMRLEPVTFNAFYQRLNITNVRTNSKYLYNYSKNLLKLWMDYSFNSFLQTGFVFQYNERMNGNVFALFNSRFNIVVQNVSFSLELNNILNRKYENIPGVAAPGRWISLGLAYNH